MNNKEVDQPVLPTQPQPRLKPPGFGQDCTVGDKLRLRCLRKAVGEYFYARRSARELVALRRQLLRSSPDLNRREVMIRIGMLWCGVSEAESESRLLAAQESFGEWPSHHDITFRNFAVYLIVIRYLRTRCATGTQLDLQRLVAKWIPNHY